MDPLLGAEIVFAVISYVLKYFAVGLGVGVIIWQIKQASNPLY